MADNESNEVWAVILGGIIGAGLASPKPEDKRDLAEYRAIKQQTLLRQQNLGKLPELDKLRPKPQLYNLFIEAYRCHVSGFFRASSILSAALLESVLKEKYGEKKFYMLIDEAEKNKGVTTAEKHYLQAIRLERNNFVHNVTREVLETDSQLVLQITIRLIDKLLGA